MWAMDSGMGMVGVKGISVRLVTAMRALIPHIRIRILRCGWVGDSAMLSEKADWHREIWSINRNSGHRTHMVFER